MWHGGHWASFFYLPQCYTFFVSTFPSCVCVEWQWTDSTKTSCLLPEGCILATSPAGQTYVHHQLHGDGSRHRSFFNFTFVERSAGQGHVATSEKGLYTLSESLTHDRIPRFSRAIPCEAIYHISGSAVLSCLTCVYMLPTCFILAVTS